MFASGRVKRLGPANLILRGMENEEADPPRGRCGAVYCGRRALPAAGGLADRPGNLSKEATVEALTALDAGQLAALETGLTARLEADEHLERLRDDFPYFCEHCVRIRTETGEL